MKEEMKMKKKCNNRRNNEMKCNMKVEEIAENKENM